MNMDTHFLEFWGNVLLTAAKGQKQMESLAPWLKSMGADASQWARLFQNIYGIATDPSDSAAWDRARRQFQSSFKEWLALFDVVPRSEVDAANKKNLQLEQEIAGQQKTIEHLRQLLEERGVPSSKAVLDFSRLMHKQSQQFQDLMGSMGKAFESVKQKTS
jgi:hypothetical protein